MTALADLPRLGVGLGFREPHREDILLRRGDVDFLEIIADHYMAPNAEKSVELDVLAEVFPLVPHGLNLSLGSAEGIDEAYLNDFAELIERIRPPWWSEHIAFTRAGGVEIGHLSPLPFTHEAVDAVCQNIERVRRVIPSTPLILENITYPLALPGAELSEAEFLRAIAESTGCGLLLDITNVYVNSGNHGYDAIEFLDSLPLDNVVQLHFVGVEERDGCLMDSHARPTPEPVWSLMEAVAERIEVRGAILERDENLPAFGELAEELERARSILGGRAAA